VWQIATSVKDGVLFIEGAIFKITQKIKPLACETKK
jgi:hypothetical protein